MRPLRGGPPRARLPPTQQAACLPMCQEARVSRITIPFLTVEICITVWHPCNQLMKRLLEDERPFLIGQPVT